mmetsp:Transcript_4788/g.9327  ORF Transcript_4788/g.9327 Transcript_4788/m.9327 type:complete len:200 (+) Transcript_4788:473-1072(+)
MMRKGNCLRRTTPVLETSKNLLMLSLCFTAASIKLCNPTLSVISGPLSPSHRAEGKAVVPEHDTTPSTPSMYGSNVSACLWSATTTSKLGSDEPNNALPFSASRVTALTLYPLLTRLATTSCPTPPVLPVTKTKSPGAMVALQSTLRVGTAALKRALKGCRTTFLDILGKLWPCSWEAIARATNQEITCMEPLLWSGTS